MSDKILAAGPWVGEFGYELFRWQGALRIKAKDYDKVVVACRSGHEFLYQDFAKAFIYYDADINQAVGRHQGAVDIVALAQTIFKKVPYTTLIAPEDKITDDAEQEFVNYSAVDNRNPNALALHARNIVINGDTGLSDSDTALKQSRNWNMNGWNGLAVRLLEAKYDLYSIGTKEASAYIPGSHDLRGMSLKELASVLSRVRAIIGPSSGPMHFATLCGCPQFVWGESFLKPRYVETWNPFKTSVSFLNVNAKWNPDAETIFGKLRRWLK